jgi:hypothetical protein
LMNRMIIQLGELPTVSYKTLEGTAEQICDICKSTAISQGMKFTIEKRTLNEFVVCKECCIVSPKSKQSSKLLINLLPLVLGNYHDSFEADEIKSSRVLLVSHLAEELITSKSKLLNIMEALERAPVKIIAQDISSECMAYFNSFSYKVGLIYQFKNLFACWVFEANSDSYNRRIRALK